MRRGTLNDSSSHLLAQNRTTEGRRRKTRTHRRRWGLAAHSPALAVAAAGIEVGGGRERPPSRAETDAPPSWQKVELKGGSGLGGYLPRHSISKHQRIYHSDIGQAYMEVALDKPMYLKLPPDVYYYHHNPITGQDEKCNMFETE